MHSLRWFCPMTPDFSRRSAKTFSWKLVWRMVLRTLELLPRCHKWEFGRLLAVTDWVLGEEFASWDCFNKLWQKMLHHCRFFIFDFNFMNVSLFYWVDLPIPWIVCEISWIISESCVVGRIPHPSNLFKQDSPRKADMDQMCLTGPKKDINSPFPVRWNLPQLSLQALSAAWSKLNSSERKPFEAQAMIDRCRKEIQDLRGAKLKDTDCFTQMLGETIT